MPAGDVSNGNDRFQSPGVFLRQAHRFPWLLAEPVWIVHEAYTHVDDLDPNL